MAFTIKQSDTSPSIRATLQDADGNPINLTGSTVRFHMKSLEGTVVVDSLATITTPLSGVITYDWLTTDTDTAGTYFAEFEVTYADSSVETFPNTGNLAIIITPELN